MSTAVSDGVGMRQALDIEPDNIMYESTVLHSNYILKAEEVRVYC